MEISVIIPAYNAEAYIERCLNSLVNQTINVSYEIIVVNDGSNDNTEAKIKSYICNYPYLIKYFSKKNGGQSSARNLGLDNAVGKYIAFVDSDDYVDANYLFYLYEMCKKSGADIAMCAMNRCLGDSGEGILFDSGFKADFTTKDISNVLKRSSFAPWNKLYSSILWDGIRFPEGMTYEDFAIIPQVIYRAKLITYRHEVLYHYYVNEYSTIMRSKLIQKTDCNIIKAQIILEKSELKNQKDVLKNFYIRRVLSSMAWSLCEYSEDFKEVQRLIDYALETYPQILSSEELYTSEYLPVEKRIFIRLLLQKHYFWAKSFVFFFSSIKMLGRNILRRFHH